MNIETPKLVIKEDIVYGEYTINKGTILTFKKNPTNIEVEFNYAGNSYKIGNYITLSPLAGMNGKSLNKDEITTCVVSTAILQNYDKKIEKVKCNCICHKEEFKGSVKHCFPCCNNGYKYKYK